jgi:hypothetical protein
MNVAGGEGLSKELDKSDLIYLICCDLDPFTDYCDILCLTLGDLIWYIRSVNDLLGLTLCHLDRNFDILSKNNLTKYTVFLFRFCPLVCRGYLKLGGGRFLASINTYDFLNRLLMCLQF